jgi:hypothetical protein
LQILTTMKYLSLRQVFTSLLVLATTTKADGSWTSRAPAVNSTSGLIIGHRAERRPSSYEFLGIKYGQAPTGELRFASPKRYIAPEGTVFEASNWVILCSPCVNGIMGLTLKIERRLPSEHTTCDDIPQFHWERLRHLQSVHGTSREPTRRGLPRFEHLDEIAIEAAVE